MRPAIKYSLIAVALAAVGAAAYLFVPSKNLKTEELAISILQDKIKQTGLYQGSFPAQCITYLTDEVTPEYVAVSLHELHGRNGCAGDPNTAPRIDSFRIFPKTKQILWDDTPNAQFAPFELALLSRGAGSAVNCSQLHDKLKAMSPLAQLADVVIGEGRAQFYSAPHAQCAIKGKFVIAGDKVTRLSSYGEWQQIRYINPQNQAGYTAWISSERLEAASK